MSHLPLAPAERARLKHLASLNLLESAVDVPLERILRCLKAALRLPWAAIIVAGRDELVRVAGTDWELPALKVEDPGFRRVTGADRLVALNAGDGEFELVRPLLGDDVTRQFFAGVPLRIGSSQTGALCIADTAPRQLSASELRVFEDFRAMAGRELELRLDSTRDHLTGLLNRRYAEHFVDREVRRASREHLPIGFIVIDLDKFKPFNDRYGHVQGDEALRQAAFAIQSCCRRPADLVARLGGEEFLVVLPSTDLPGTERLLQRLTEAFGELNLVHEDSPTGRLTFSAGAVVASEAELPMALSDIVDAADQLLYEVKRQGRNGYRVRPLAEVLPPPAS